MMSDFCFFLGRWNIFTFDTLRIFARDDSISSIQGIFSKMDGDFFHSSTCKNLSTQENIPYMNCLDMFAMSHARPTTDITIEMAILYYNS